MRYGSVCSGIEAATMAWHPLGWTPAFFSEIEKFPSAVLAHHYGSNMPGESDASNGVPNHGDMTKFEEWPDHAIDLLVGGTPCQDFSVAGLRAGLDGARGSLMLTYGAIARRYRPRWLAWENVPGVLSDDGGRGFASLLGLLSGRRVEVPAKGWRNAGVVEGYKGAYGLAWRVLDAQYIRVDGFERAVPQRRRRVFVIGYLGDWRRAAAVLFEPESLCGNPPPRRQQGQDAAGAITASAGRRGGTDEGERGKLVAEVAPTLNAAFGSKLGLENQHIDGGAGLFVGHTVGFNTREDPDSWLDRTGPLGASLPQSQAVAFGGDVARTLSARHDSSPCADRGMDVVADSTWSVRRLTPRECERLQGYPDDFTLIPWRGGLASDGPRYKGLGNTMAVNVMRWLGTRIQIVDRLQTDGVWQ